MSTALDELAARGDFEPRVIVDAFSAMVGDAERFISSRGKGQRVRALRGLAGRLVPAIARAIIRFAAVANDAGISSLADDGAWTSPAAHVKRLVLAAAVSRALTFTEVGITFLNPKRRDRRAIARTVDMLDDCAFYIAHP